MAKIKVLQSISSLGVGGNEIFVMNLLRHIDKTKFQIDFVVYDNQRLDFYDEVLEAGGKVYFCQSNHQNKGFKLLNQIGMVKKILKDNKYDIIHCNSCSLFGILRGTIAGKSIGNIKVIAHSHNSGTPKNTLGDKLVRTILKKYLCSTIDYGFSCSDVAGESKYTKRFMKSSAYYTINNAIEIEKYIYSDTERKSIRTNMNIDDSTFVIGHVGRFEKQKNHKFIIDIFEKILDKRPNSKLLLVGDGSLLNEIKDYANKKQIGDQIIFAGQQDNVSVFYSAMDCFLLPSLYEGFPFVLVEAQINGLKCIISDNITKSVNIADGVCFWGLEQDEESWADHVIEFGNYRLNKEQILKVTNMYDINIEIKKIEELYQQLMEN